MNESLEILAVISEFKCYNFNMNTLPDPESSTLKTEEGDRIVAFIETAKRVMTACDQAVALADKVIERVKEHAGVVQAKVKTVMRKLEAKLT